MVRNMPSGRNHWPDHLRLGQIFSFRLGMRTVIGSVNESYFVD